MHGLQHGQNLSSSPSIGVRANIHLGGQNEFCPNGFSGGGVVAEIFRDQNSVGGGVVAEIFRDPYFVGWQCFFPLTAVTDPKFVLFKHVLCFARIISTLCPNSCRQTARIGGAAAPPAPPVPYAYVTIPKKGNLQLCNNYRTISLISHGSKVMLKIILNRMRPLAENIIAEEQAGFRRGRSTIEQIFNLRILCEKHLQHQRNIYNVFIDFKRAFDRVWHEALWATMKKFNISGKLIETIQSLYENAMSAVLV